MPQKPKAPEWLIENIAEASKNARKIYFLYLGFLAYCALTVISTSDRQIILNETATLPILKIEVSLNGFFLLGPLIAILVFVYFQLYLHRLKCLVDDLRTNYTSIGKGRLYPWMINIAEDPDPGPVGTLQRIIVAFSVWASLTLVLILFAFWYVKKHEPIWSYVVGSSPIVGFLITFWFWLRYELGKPRKSAWRKIFNFIGFALIVAFEICLFLVLIPWAREGGKYKWIRPLICVNLSYQKLVTEPEKDYPGLYWANLREVHLEGADLRNSVLKRVDFRKANLQNAVMGHVILEKADLSGANLQKADLEEANLEKANLRSANLRETKLTMANLQEADLNWANLQGATLGMMALLQGSFSSAGANLLRAKLYEADLRRAYMEDANLQEADLRNADLEGAVLRKANLRKAKMRRANLHNAELTGATVVHDSGKRFRLRANLEEADLRDANLEGARLDGANLRSADLRGARNLTLKQLSKVATLYDTKLDLSLSEKISEAFPNLLIEPEAFEIEPDLLEEIKQAFPHLLVEPEE